MKKTMCAILAFLMLLSLTACGTKTTDKGADRYLGTWKIDHMIADGVSYALSELEALDAYGRQASIVIKEGGKAYAAEDGTDGVLVDWSETENGILLDDMEAFLKDGFLCLDVSDDETWCFKKVSDSQLIEKPAEQEGQKALAEATAPEHEDIKPTEPESLFSADAEPVDGEVYISEDFEFVQYTDGSIALAKYIGNDATVTISTEIAGYPVSRIGAEAFEDCAFIEDIYLWADIISIGEAAFRNCEKLESFSIPSTVTSIADSTFENCTSLENAYIWGEVTGIGNSAFRNCAALESMSIPSSCDAIGESAFENCTSLESAHIWGDATSIGSSAFRNCAALERVTIPTECRAIGESAFEGCTSLESVTYWGESVTCGADAFADCPNLKKLPKGIVYAKGASPEEPKSDTPTGGTKAALSEGMRPEFKEAMDAYEAFYDEYCDFMVNYQKNPTDMKLITQYGQLMTKMVDVNEAFDKWDESDLNDEELKYYLEVNSRVMQKLVDVTGE